MSQTSLDTGVPRSVEVINLHTCKDFGTRVGDVLCDRHTKWGNPYKICKTRSRNQSIRMYEVYFVKHLLQDIEELRGARRLGCWCKPFACHCDVIKKYLEKL
jgi:hypothetical protein